MNYTLMNKNEEVVRFNTYRNEYGAVRAENVQILGRELLPPEYSGDLIRFIDKRKAPKHRKYIQSILKQ